MCDAMNEAGYRKTGISRIFLCGLCVLVEFLSEEIKDGGKL